MSVDVVARAKAALEGVTAGPWEHRTAPSNDSEETHADWLTGTLIGEGEELHVLIAESPEPRFAYIVPAVTGDGPNSAKNAEFIAAARALVPELVAEVEKLRGALETIRQMATKHAPITTNAGVVLDHPWSLTKDSDILAVIERAGVEP